MFPAFICDIFVYTMITWGLHFEPNILINIGSTLVQAFLGSKVFQRLGTAYVMLGSSKFTGTWLGGYLGGAQPSVRNNLGLRLLPQAGRGNGIGDRLCGSFFRLWRTWGGVRQINHQCDLSHHFLVQII